MLSDFDKLTVVVLPARAGTGKLIYVFCLVWWMDRIFNFLFLSSCKYEATIITSRVARSPDSQGEVLQQRPQYHMPSCIVEVLRTASSDGKNKNAVYDTEKAWKDTSGAEIWLDLLNLCFHLQRKLLVHVLSAVNNDFSRA